MEQGKASRPKRAGKLGVRRVTVCGALSQETHDNLVSHCARVHQSMSEVIDQAVVQYLSRLRQPD